MHALLAAVTIVKFVGLCAFTDRLPNAPGMHAVLPRIADGSGIEQHVAILAYHGKACAKAPCPGVTLRGVPGYRYIPLDGGRVHFQVNGENPEPTAASLPPLPHLATCCPNMGKLSGAFRGPSYEGAAAIVDIPAGTLTSCGAQIAGMDASHKRIDTTLSLQSTGKTIVVSIVRNDAETTTLTLRADAAIIIANLPKPWVAGHRLDYHMTGTPHYQAYYGMGSGDGSACNSLENCSPIVPLCVDQAFLKTDGLIDPFTASSECSNSQWP
jgi:hypothetical protein